MPEPQVAPEDPKPEVLSEPPAGTPVESKAETLSFPIQESTAKQIETVFTYHKPKDQEVADRCQEVRDAFKLYATYVAKKVPPSRELSMALTHLENASMQAIAGIVRNQ